MNTSAGILQFVSRSVAVFLVMFVVTARDVHAYVDPGTGTMILQIIAALVAGALFYVRQIRVTVASWFSRFTARARGGDHHR